MSREIKVIGIALIICIATSVITGCGNSSSVEAVYTPSNMIRKNVSSNSKFTYETSLTDSISNEKSDVYKTKLSVKEATKEITNMGSLTDSKKLLEDRANILKFGNEEVFIYEGENPKDTYVQISNEAYVANKGYSYSHRGGSFLRTYGVLSLCDDFSRGINSYKIKSSKKSSGGSSKSSIRNSSSGSRPSSGGGTSFGK